MPIIQYVYRKCVRIKVLTLDILDTNTSTCKMVTTNPSLGDGRQKGANRREEIEIIHKLVY